MAELKDALTRTGSRGRPSSEDGSYRLPATDEKADTRTLIWAIAAVVIMLIIGYVLVQRGTVNVEVKNPAGSQNQPAGATSSRANATPTPVVPANGR